VIPPPPPRIAVFGGSFDPVHRGHLAVADAVAARLHPDLFLWVPARQAPHKPACAPAPGSERLALLRRVLADRSGETVLALELERPGPSYTVETLEALRGEHPRAEFVLILGADSLSHLAGWRRVGEIFDGAVLGFVPRPGWGPESLAAFRKALPPALARRFRAEWIEMDEVPVSSTEIRRRLAAGEPCGDLLPPGLEEEIRKRGLYCRVS